MSSILSQLEISNVLNQIEEIDNRYGLKGAFFDNEEAFFVARDQLINSLGHFDLLKDMYENNKELTLLNFIIDSLERTLQSEFVKKVSTPAGYSMLSYNLSRDFSRRFELLENDEDIRKAVHFSREAAYLTPEDSPYLLLHVRWLFTSLTALFKYSPDTTLLDEIMDCGKYLQASVPDTPEGKEWVVASFSNTAAYIYDAYTSNRMPQLRDKAIELLESIKPRLLVHPFYISAYLQLGVWLWQKYFAEKAPSLLEQVTQHFEDAEGFVDFANPSYGDLHYKLGVLNKWLYRDKRELNRIRSSSKHFQIAANWPYSMSPDMVLYRANLAFSLIEEGYKTQNTVLVQEQITSLQLLLDERIKNSVEAESASLIIGCINEISALCDLDLSIDIVRLLRKYLEYLLDILTPQDSRRHEYLFYTGRVLFTLYQLDNQAETLSASIEYHRNAVLEAPKTVHELGKYQWHFRDVLRARELRGGEEVKEDEYELTISALSEEYGKASMLEMVTGWMNSSRKGYDLFHGINREAGETFQTLTLENLDSMILHYHSLLQEDGLRSVNYTRIVINLARAIYERYQRSWILEELFAAKKYFELALGSCSPQNMPQLFATAASGYGQLLYAQGMHQKAENYFGMARTAISTLNNFYSNEIMDENRDPFTWDIYAHLVSRSLKVSNVQQAFYFIETAKRKALTDLFHTARFDLAGLGLEQPNIFAKIQRLQQIRKERDEFHSLLDRALEAKHLRPNSFDIDHMQEDLYRSFELEQEFLNELYKDHPSLVRLNQRSIVSLEQAKQLSQSLGVIFLEYYQHSTGWCVIVIDQESVRSVPLPNLNENIIERMHRWMDYIHYPEGRNALSVTEVLFDWYDALFQPIHNKISKDKTLVVAPFGELCQLPMHVARNRDTLLFVAEEYLLSFTSSLDEIFSAVMHLSNNEHLREPDNSKQFLAVAYPGMTGSPGYLLNAVSECEAICPLFIDSQKLYDNQATRDNTLMEIPGYKIVHFACHGNLSSDKLMQAGLLLAGGLLSTDDIIDKAQLYDAQLVTLAACRSGSSILNTSDVSSRLAVHRRVDNLVGLVQAVTASGAQAVVSSLWDVHDKVSKLMFGQFYRYIIAEDAPTSALQKASSLIKKHPKYKWWQHPFYWAAYQANGLSMLSLDIKTSDLIESEMSTREVFSIELEENNGLRISTSTQQGVRNLLEGARVLLEQLHLLVVTRDDLFHQPNTRVEIRELLEGINANLSAPSLRSNIIIKSVYEMISSIEVLRQYIWGDELEFLFDISQGESWNDLFDSNIEHSILVLPYFEHYKRICDQSIDILCKF